MKTTIRPVYGLPVPLLQAQLMEQQAEGDAEAVKRTRALLDRAIERERLRNQAQRAGRWPFTVTGPKPGGEQ